MAERFSLDAVELTHKEFEKIKKFVERCKGRAKVNWEGPGGGHAEVTILVPNLEAVEKVVRYIYKDPEDFKDYMEGFFEDRYSMGGR